MARLKHLIFEKNSRLTKKYSTGFDGLTIVFESNVDGFEDLAAWADGRREVTPGGDGWQLCFDDGLGADFGAEKFEKSALVEEIASADGFFGASGVGKAKIEENL
jgi:hypothetical protein